MSLSAPGLATVSILEKPDVLAGIHLDRLTTLLRYLQGGPDISRTCTNVGTQTRQFASLPVTVLEMLGDLGKDETCYGYHDLRMYNQIVHDYLVVHQATAVCQVIYLPPGWAYSCTTDLFPHEESTICMTQLDVPVMFLDDIDGR